MAKQPHHDDEQPKKKKPGDKAPATPKPKPVPNLSIEDDEPLAIEEIVEAEPVPLAEPMPADEVLMAEPIEEDPFVLAGEEVLAEEVVEATPMESDVFLADAAEEVMEAEPIAEEEVLASEVVVETTADTPPHQAKPASDVAEAVLADDVVEVSGSSAVLAEAHAAPASEVDLMKLLGEASAPPVAEPIHVTAGPATDVQTAAPVAVAGPATDIQPAWAAEPAAAMPGVEPVVAAPASEVMVAAEQIGSAPFSEIVAAAEPVAAAPPSEVIAAHEPIEHAPAAPVMASVPDDVLVEAMPASGVVADDVVEEVVEAMPESAVVAEEAVEEVVEAMPESGVVAEEAVEEAAPASAVAFVDEEIAEAMPESAVVADEEVAEAMPESAVIAEEEIAEAMPESAVVAEEEVAEAVPASGVMFADEESMPASAVEAIAETSSATRKSEAVLGDEVEPAEAVSAMSGVEEAEAVEAESGIVFEDATESLSALKPSKSGAHAHDLEPTTAFAAQPDDDDELVTEEEVVGASEASAVDLGDVPAKKGSSVTGIDKVAEALESGIDLGATAPPESSVEFDEILDEASEEVDLGALEEDKPTPKSKKKAKPAKGTGDDIDLNDLFGDDEIAEASEALEAEEVEAAEGTDELTAEEAGEAEVAFDEEIAETETEEAAAEALDEEAYAEAGAADEAEAADAFNEEVEAAEATEGDELADFGEDEKPAKTKLGKKTRVHDDDDEAAEAAEDEDEDVSAKKKKGKKGKKDKEKAIPAPVAQSSTFLRIAIGMFVMFVLISVVLVGGWFGANAQIRDFAKSSLDLHEKAPPPPPKKALELANAAFAKRDYAGTLEALKAANDPEEYNVRGQARWFAYVEDAKKKNAPLDKDAPAVKEALEDLGAKKGNNPILLTQIREQVELPMREKALTDQIAELKTKKETVETDLAKVTKEKDDADKKIDSLADILAKSKIIEDKTKLDAAVVQKMLQDLNLDKAMLASVNKLLKDAEVKGGGEEGVKEVIKLRDSADKSLAAVNKVLDDEKIKEKGDKGVLEIVEARNKTIKDRDDLLKTVGDAFKEFVDGKIVPENADPRKMIVAGAKLARQKAESPLSIPLAQLGVSLGSVGAETSKVVEKTFDLSKTFSELGFYRTREPFIQTPEQKQDTYIALLANRKRNDPKQLAAITREADWVLSKESKADAEARTKARFVQGLAARNLEKFADAKSAFDDTLNRLKPIKAGPWSKAVAQAKLEITDPTVYYMPRMDAFRADQNYKAAFDEANIALKAMPNDPRLLAERGLIRYEAVRGQGVKIPGDVQKEIRADAGAAAKDEKMAAESAYILGLLEEDLQNWPEAEKDFRQALKLHMGTPEDAGKYRVSLARLLLRDREAAPIAAPPQPEEKKLDKKDEAKEEKKVGRTDATQRTIVMHPWSMLTAALIVAQPGEEPEDKETMARVNETIKLAKELIASKNDKLKGQGYLLMGSALSKIGKRTEGLKEYAKGLKLVYPGIETKEMDQLINDHPAFQQPDISGTPNPVMAERHFGEGMHLYWSKDFEKAEAQFKTAVKYFDRDARYQYYLGLAQLAQKSRAKRDAAYFSFEVGARLEAKSVSTNPYAARDINMSLERIQGPVRELLNSFRFKALDPEADAKAPDVGSK